MIVRLVTGFIIAAVIAIFAWMAIVDAAIWEVELRHEQVRQLKGRNP